MGQKIWGVLTAYEGQWVAVDKDGKVVAHTQTLPELMRIAEESPCRLTLLYAAPEPESELALRS